VQHKEHHVQRLWRNDATCKHKKGNYQQGGSPLWEVDVSLQSHPISERHDCIFSTHTSCSCHEVAAPVVGAWVVGEAVVGTAVVGEAVVSAPVVGASVVGEAVVGEAVVGALVVGATVVGDAVVGEAVVGAPVVGASGNGEARAIIRAGHGIPNGFPKQLIWTRWAASALEGSKSFVRFQQVLNSRNTPVVFVIFGSLGSQRSCTEKGAKTFSRSDVWMPPAVFKRRVAFSVCDFSF